MFLVIKMRKKHPIYMSKKCCKDKQPDLLLVGVKYKKHYALIKDFNTFMYDHTLHIGKNVFAVIFNSIKVWVCFEQNIEKKKHTHTHRHTCTVLIRIFITLVNQLFL